MSQAQSVSDLVTLILAKRAQRRAQRLGVEEIPPPSLAYYEAPPPDYKGFGSKEYGNFNYGNEYLAPLKYGLLIGTVTKMTDSVWIAQRSEGFGKASYTTKTLPEAIRLLGSATSDQPRMITDPNSNPQITYVYVPTTTGLAVEDDLVGW